MVATLGAERVFFGSDPLNNLLSEFTKFSSIGLRSAELELCLHGNAKKLFKL
jgi:predicted TIM-barrel fold metal-dependent hydrolase